MNQVVHGDFRLPDPSRSFGAVDRFLRRRLLSRLGGLRYGSLVLEDGCGRVELGDSRASAETLRVGIRVSDPAFYRVVAAGGSVGAAEAYMDGLWQSDDLVSLVRLLVRNRDLLDGLESGPARLASALLRGWHSMNRNTRSGSSRNVAAHYDLGNDFFSLFLSPDLMYSSAIWEDGDTLESASTRKLERVCQKLNLRRSDRVIEIGSGWGGFALHAASKYGCHVTTITLSREQYELATRRVRECRLEDRIDVVLRDYRDVYGTFDKLVSIEMVEAIGHQYLSSYFSKVGSLLKPGGLALLQAITIEDHRYAQAVAAVDFIKRHVFPGSFIPSIQAMLTAKTRATDLAVVHLEDFGSSYARTLSAWRANFLARLSAVRAQGFDERFIRMWDFYFAYCEGGFRERSIGVAQLLFAKPAY
jgi:cyclopropane-fatty-acyl-phospholipid synthase